MIHILTMRFFCLDNLRQQQQQQQPPISMFCALAYFIFIWHNSTERKIHVIFIINTTHNHWVRNFYTVLIFFREQMIAKRDNHASLLYTTCFPSSLVVRFYRNVNHCTVCLHFALMLIGSFYHVLLACLWTPRAGAYSKAIFSTRLS